MNINLLANPTRIETPFIKVTIGDYTFGVFSETSGIQKTADGAYRYKLFQYPNYIKSLQIVKVNGQFNQYTLQIDYAITENNDPNFFEKVFSSVSKSRKITFSYGDLSAPKFLYKNEEAMITKISNQFDNKSAKITYTVSAVSVGKLSTASSYNFVSPEFTGVHQPSVIIKKLLKLNSKYGLQDIFSGMRNIAKVESYNLIPSDDLRVELEPKENINIIDYIKYLVSNMRNSQTKSLYQMIVVDDTSGNFDGCYFKIVDAANSASALDMYDIDIGYPSDNVVTAFQIDNNENFSILYNYNTELNTNEYITRIDDTGKEKTIYSPNITSNNDEQITHSNDLNWWKNVTAFPISATLTLKGVLRPTILMSKINLSVLFFGKAHISSGIYLITKQVDTISGAGCSTTLNLVRVDGDSNNFKEFL